MSLVLSVLFKQTRRSLIGLFTPPSFLSNQEGSSASHTKTKTSILSLFLSLSLSLFFLSVSHSFFFVSYPPPPPVSVHAVSSMQTEWGGDYLVNHKAASDGVQ